MWSNHTWNSGQVEIDGLISTVLDLKRQLEEQKIRLDYVEEALLLPEEREALDGRVQGLRRRDSE